MMLLAFALQAAAAATAPASGKFSILVPVAAAEPCARRPGRDTEGHDIIVCADPLPSQKLPYPDEIVPDGPVPSNPYRSGAAALAAQATPCPISRNCVVGFGPPIMPILKGAAGLAKRAFARKPDKTGRVPIPLDDSGTPTGRIEP